MGTCSWVSLGPLLGMFDKIQHPSVALHVVQKGLGNITDVDVLNAETSKAVIYGFNVRSLVSAQELAREKNVTIKECKIIYQLFDDVLERLQALLPSEHIVEEIGKIIVMANFRKTENGWIVGGRVKTGIIMTGANMRVLRKDELIGEGRIEKLQVGKTEVKEVSAGQECGMRYKGRIKVEEGDILEIYKEEDKGQKLEIEGIRRR